MNHLLDAYHILTDYYRTPETNLKLLISRHLDRTGSQDAANTSRTVYGIIRKEKLLDVVIRRFSRIPLKKIDLPTSTLLKIGIFLMLFSGGFPDYAVVNEVVSAAPKKSKQFINGILRALGRQKESAHTAIAAVTDAAVRHSLNPTLVRQLSELAGDKLQAALEYLDSEPVFHLKPNPAKISYPALVKELSAAAIPIKELPSFQSIEIKQPGKIKNLVSSHTAYFQNTASQLISFLAAHYGKKSVLDCCAAPGSKTATLKQQKPDLRIVAADINHSRLRMLQPVIRQHKLRDVSLMVMDAQHPALHNCFDLVMVDAPCSSVGTIRKNPDLKLKTDEKIILRNAGRQKKILDSLLKQFPGRTYLYSVCSFTAQESEDVIAALSQNHCIEEIDISELLEGYGFNFVRGQHGAFLLPTPSLNNDLFYISLFSDGCDYTHPEELIPEAFPLRPPG